MLRKGAAVGERGMRVVTLVLVIGAAMVLLAGGCGRSSDVSGASAAPASLTTKSKPAKENVLKEHRRQLRVALRKFQDRDEACSVLSDRYIDYTFDAPGRRGRQQCEQEVKAAPPNRLRSYRVLELSSRRATVKVVDARGTTVKVKFVFDGQKWLVDSITSLD
jgi:hypothetical protein